MLILTRLEVVLQPEVVRVCTQFNLPSKNLICLLEGVGMKFEINPYRLEKAWQVTHLSWLKRGIGGVAYCLAAEKRCRYK